MIISKDREKKNRWNPVHIHDLKANGDFPGGPVVDSRLATTGTWVQSLVSELRSSMVHGQKKSIC